MLIAAAADRSRNAPGPSRHSALLVGASTLALTLALSAGQGASARPLNGGATVSATSNAAAAAIVSAQQAAAATQQSMNSLSRAAQAIQAMQAAQAAARKLSQSTPNGVPNGLAAGGLTPDSGLAGAGVANTVTTWTNANTPTQATSDGETVVTVKQTAQKAILNWSSFNIGGDTELYINQSAGNSSTGNGWIALNRVTDPSGAPSQILGQIKAEGSVYLIDANGVIFGGSSQVNVSSLIASSLNLFSNTFGDANTPGTTVYRFLNGGIGDLNTTNFATDSILLTSATSGAGPITIEAGASITLNSTGLAVIAAPNVTNSGAITAPSGQVALIAGVGVSYGYNESGFNPGGLTPRGTNDNSTTNLEFANSGQWLADGSDVTPRGVMINNGLITTPRGNITMLGGTIEQNGVAIATTSVEQPGTIVINSLYEFGVKSYTGAVDFGAQAVTSVLPDSNGVTLPSDPTSLARFHNPSQTGFLPTEGPGLISITGQAIDFQGGALVYAPGQTITAETSVVLDPRTSVPPVPGSGGVLLESGAVLDVSGIADVELSVTANLLTVKLGGNELADSPLQQDGALYGATVTVDMRDSGVNAETGESWVGTPLANLSSYANLVQNSIDQLLVNGGAISLGGNQVVAAPGSIINLMGGYVHYLGGMIDTTELIGADGRLYNIGSANPDMTYVGVAGQFTVDHAHWGVSETYIDPLLDHGYYEPDYIQGGNAGSLSISGSASSKVQNSGAVVLDSTLLAGALTGTLQAAAGTPPSDGSFSFTGAQPIEIGDPGTLSATGLSASSVPNGYTMASPLLATAGSAYAAVNVISASMLNAANFKNISLTSAPTSSTGAQITEDAGAALTVQPGGSINLTGAAITINGVLTARAGSISVSSNAGDIVVGANGVLDVSGIFFNESPQTVEQQQAATALVNGGSIALATGAGNITLAAGSLLDLEGGGVVLSNGQLQTGGNGAPIGSGGSLSLATEGSAVPPPSSILTSPYMLTLDGAIDALGFSGGGALTLQTAAMQIGGDAATTPSYAFYFDPVKWGDLGFGSFNLSTELQAEVPANATVSLHHVNLLPNYPAIESAPSGADPAAYATAGFLTGTLLSPTNLSVTAGLEQSENYDGVPAAGKDYAQVDLGARIIADPGASVSIASYSMTNIFGSIKAPGGKISLTVEDWATQGNGTGSALGPLYIGPNSMLDVSGVTEINPLPAPVHTASGWVDPITGKILAGGAITLTDNYSPILVAPGAVFNVSGASGVFQVEAANSSSTSLHGGVTLTNQQVWSDAGTVNLAGAGGLLFEGTLIGQPGAPQAQGGTLTITGDSTTYGGTPNIVLVQDAAAAMAAAGSTFSFASYVPTPTANGAPTISKLSDQLLGVDSLSGNGFSSLTLTNNAYGGDIGFAGTVSLTLGNSFVTNGQIYNASSLANLNWIYGTSGSTKGASLTVTAPYIAINSAGGIPNQNSINPAPSDAQLTMTATKQLDLSGFLYFANLGQATFVSSGDIRLLPVASAPAGGNQLVGYLLTGANLTFEAADVYPATDTAFVIQSKPAIGAAAPTTISFEYPSGVAPSTVTPLSAGGTLLVDASAINQNGEISAPFGSIVLGINSSSATAISATLGTSSANNNLYYTGGTATTSVTLGVGSITSVSANGATIPFGSTVDQTTWVYNPIANWGVATVPAAFTTPLTGAPQGAVTLTGNAVNFNSGATINLSGGGDLQAQEWIAGTGGSRNLLLQSQTSYAASTSGTQVPTYPDGRQIYAILPGYSGSVAPYDANLSQSGMTAGESVYLAGGNGLAAGYYTLLPAQYATLPGAYRVVLDSSSPGVLSNATITLADGTMVMQGNFANAITGSSSSTTELFYVQSAAAWEKYSQYVLTSANSFFPSYAATNGLAAPNVAADAGRLAVAATAGLVLSGAIQGAAAAGGTGAQVDISSQYIEIVDSGSGSTTIAGQTYLEVGAQQLDALGVSSLLIGGVRSQTSAGTVITPTANGVVVANDSSAPLIAPEIMLAAAPKFSTSNGDSTITLDAEGDSVQVSTPVSGTGQVTIQSNAVVQASGAFSGAEPMALILGGVQLPTLPTMALVSDIQSGSVGALLVSYYAALDADLGSLVRVSNGAPVTLQLPSAAQISPGAIAVTDNVNASNPVTKSSLTSLSGSNSGASAVIQTGATVTGGNSLTLVSTGDVQVQSGALLSGANITARSSSISFLGAGAIDPQTGLEIDAATLAELESAQTVNLQSYGGVAFYGDVTVAMTGANSVLTLGGDSLSNNGGAVTISAPTLVLDNELGGAPPTTLTTGSGALSINVGALIFGAGAKSLTGFGSMSVAASRGIVGQGTGGMNFGSLPLTLQTPILIADTSSTQTLTTTGALSVAPIAGGVALASTALGGAITLQGGSVTVSAPVQALAGNISLEASSGNVEVAGAGSLIAHGVAKQFVDVTEYASAGTITLFASQGAVLVDSGALVDFAGASGGGNGGSLSVSAPSGNVALNGTLLGATASGFTGGSFTLNAGGAATLDALAQILTTAGVTGGIAIETGQGDLSLSRSLTASSVSLTADAGLVTVGGAITANGTASASGEINLYGAKGVDVEGALLATGSPNSQKPGGLINIGTTGAGSTTSLNSTYGYENVDPSASGAIAIGANAVIDASGGTITFRAPILDAPNAQGVNVNVAIAPTAQVKAGTVFLDAYAVWSAADSGATPAQQAGGDQHFDGYVDPAGWYNASGNLVAGGFQDINGNAVASWDGAALSGCSGTCNSLSYYLTNDYFTPTSYNAAHAVFYGGYNPNNNESFNPSAPDAGSLPAFVQQPGFQFGAAFASIANFTARPEIDLVNPAPSNGGVNGGNISVLTNWNLGAGVMNSNGSFTLAYRYKNTIAPVVSLRAAGNINILASISDAFFQTSSVYLSSPSPTPLFSSDETAYTTENNSNLTVYGATTVPVTSIEQASAETLLYNYGASSSAGSKNVGNGALNSLALSSSPQAGVYTITFTSSTKFTVTFPSGVTSTGTVGAAFSARSAIKFTIAAGTKAFAAGDSFTVNVSDSAVLAKSGNAGNGAVSAPSLLTGAQAGAYTISFTSATGYNVVAPNGTTVGAGTIGVAFANQLGFTVSSGSTPFKSGDSFSITVATLGGLEASDTNYQLQAPQAGGSAAYYTVFSTYQTYYNTWAQAMIGGLNGATGKSGTSTETFALVNPSQLAALPNSAPALSPGESYSAYSTAYGAYVKQAVTTGTYYAYTAPTPPLASDTSQADWTSYYSDWSSYSATFATLKITLGGSTTNSTINTFFESAPAAPQFQAFVAPVAINTPSNMATAADPLSVQVAQLIGGQSASYRVVAGAALDSANPLALQNAAQFASGAGQLAGEGNVLISGHVVLDELDLTNAEIAAPTTVRTGAGSIDIAAAGNFDLLDALAPGVVYTAGTIAQASPAATTVALGQGVFKSSNYTSLSGISTILTPAVNPTDGGDITLTVGGSIVGVENVVDNLANSSSAASGLTSKQGAFVGQFWEPWLLLTNPSTSSTSSTWYVNFGSFDQGVMSIGGNVAVKAGGDIHDLAVSLPTTSWLDSANVTHITGGGDLSVTAGGSIYSGDFYVGQGSGAIAAGGAIASDFTYIPAYSASTTSAFPVATLLAVQYGAIAVDARQSVDIGGVFDPTYLSHYTYNPQNVASPPVASYTSVSAAPIDLVPYVTSMSTTSGVSVQSTGGDLTFNSLLAQGVLNLGNGASASLTSLLLPASLDLAALSGGVTVDHGGGLYPSATGTLSIIADQSVNLSVPLEPYQVSGSGLSYQLVTFPTAGNVFGASLGKLDYLVGTGILPTASNPTLLNVWNLTPAQSIDPALVAAEEAAPTDPVRIYSLNGSIIDGEATTASEGKIYELINTGTNGSPLYNSFVLNIVVGGTVGQISIIPNAPAQIYAGADILDMPFYGENFTASEITSIVAGRDIRSNIYGDAQPAAIELAGPGSLMVQAGRDLTFASEPNVPSSSTSNYETGIRTLGDSIDPNADPIYGSPAPANRVSPYTTTTYLADFGNPYLPAGGASVTVKFGVGPGVDAQAFVAAYLDPASGAATALTAQEWTEFQTLTTAQQQLVVDQAFFDILNATGLNYNDPSSSTYKQYTAGYQAINTLFPAVYGYTQNALTGGVNGANQLISTGTFDMRGSTVQTQQGGDISILGPGGRILVGSAAASPAVDPASQGVLTLESGDIDIFADTDVLVAQSRVMTEQGGDIVMWSSNGDLDAGKGAKTSVSAPPPLYSCDIDFHCSADIKGAVSGAGIATLQSLPNASIGDANLMAPRGTVNAGAAGIRVSGNLNIAALFVGNAFNIQVGGTAIGVAPPPPNIGALTTGNNQAGVSAQQATAPTGQNAADRPSIIMVEILGFGGGDGTPPQDLQNDDKRRKGNGPQSYNPNSLLQLVGNGPLSEAQKRALTDEERRSLDDQ